MAADRLVHRGRAGAGEAARALHDQGVQRRAHLALAGAAPGGAPVLCGSSGVRENEDQHWLAYAFGMLLFNAAGFFLLYAILRLQAYLPLNPQGFGNVPPDLAFNTAISFTTNTNWQNYVGEATMSYFSQMAGLTVHNFVSAATGIALAVALIRGFARRSAQGIGNFWVDLTRCCLYVLLPISHRDRAVPGVAGHAAELRSPMSPPRPWTARSRPSRRDRSPRRSRSRCWAPMAAASSTPTPRIRTRTRPRSATSCRWCRSSPSAPRSPTCSAA